MTETLLAAVRRYAEAHANPDGYLNTDGYPNPDGAAQTPIAGLSIIRQMLPGGLVYAVSKPLVCLVLQGRKQVVMGTQSYTFEAGDSLLITADVPTVSQITGATAAEPYLSLVVDLDPLVIADLTVQIKAEESKAVQMAAAHHADGAPVRAEQTDSEVEGAALRLMRLLDRPAALPVLHGQLLRELQYWLLAGRHGAAIGRLGWPGGHSQQVARAVAVLRAEFAQALPIGRLAAVAGMSASSFHHHFRAVTSLSPLQFQKQLRLIEARRLMTVQGVSASSAAFSVGYESVPQFTREYGRMFGLPPVRDAQIARRSAGAA